MLMPDSSAAPTSVNDPWFTRLVLACGLLVFAIVVLSAWLRLRANGLDCAPWPACFGAPGVARATPFWAMLTHRAAAGLLGFGVLALLWRAWRHPRNAAVRFAVSVLFALTILLALLGRLTPAPRLPWVTLGNLLGGMGMLALLGWLYTRIRVPADAGRHAGRLRSGARVALAVLVLQIALGGWVSANLAAPACPRLAACDVSFSPALWAEAFDPARQLTGEGTAPAAGAPAKLIHVAHRLGALVAFLYIGGLAVAAVRAGGAPRGAGLALAALLLLQVALGAGGVALDLPLWLVTAHNANAAALLLGVVYLNRLLTSETPS